MNVFDMLIFRILGERKLGDFAYEIKNADANTMHAAHQVSIRRMWCVATSEERHGPAAILDQSEFDRKPHARFRPWARKPRRAQSLDWDTVGTKAHIALVNQLVSRAFSVSLSDLTSAARCNAKISFARQVAMYLAHVVCGLSLNSVGKQYRRDRTTVSHACKLIEDNRDDRVLDTSLDFLEGALCAWLQAMGRWEDLHAEQ